MKKILLYLLFCFSVFPWTNKFDTVELSYSKNPDVQVRVVKIDEIYGKLTFISDNKITSDNKSQSVQIEIYQPLLKVDKHKVKIGYGVKLQEPVPFDSDYAELTYVLPLYFSTLYEFNQNKYDCYGKFNIGYGLAIKNTDKVKKFDGYDEANTQGGLYFSLESGVMYKNMVLGLSYNQTSTKLIVPKDENQNGGKVDIDYSMFSLSFGYKFQIEKIKN